MAMAYMLTVHPREGMAGAAEAWTAGAGNGMAPHRADSPPASMEQTGIKKSGTAIGQPVVSSPTGGVTAGFYIYAIPSPKASA